jgi:hypothetical protein
VTSTDERGQSVTAETSIEACALYQARFVDTLRLYLGPSGHVQAAEEATSTRACPDKLKAKVRMDRSAARRECGCRLLLPPFRLHTPASPSQPMTFKTTVVFRRPSAGQQ